MLREIFESGELKAVIGAVCDTVEASRNGDPRGPDPARETDRVGWLRAQCPVSLRELFEQYEVHRRLADAAAELASQTPAGREMRDDDAIGAGRSGELVIPD